MTAGATRCTGHVMPAACWALLELLDGEGPLRVGDIAAQLGLDASSITPRLKVLEAEGLVGRTRDADDRRVSVISISASGRVALDRVHTARLALFARALTPEDMDRLPGLTETLDRITQSLQESLSALPADKTKEATE